jgi:hypothetical protein
MRTPGIAIDRQGRGDEAMADPTGSNNTAIVAVLVIFLVAALGVGLYVFRGQIFGGSNAKDDVQINLTLPSD